MSPHCSLPEEGGVSPPHTHTHTSPSPLGHHPGECRVCALLGRAGAPCFPWQPACQPQPGPLRLWRLEDQTDPWFGFEKAGAVSDGLA